MGIECYTLFNNFILTICFKNREACIFLIHFYIDRTENTRLKNAQLAENEVKSYLNFKLDASKTLSLIIVLN